MTTRIVFTVLVALAVGLGYWSAPMATLFLNDEGKILFAPDTSSPMYDEDCCCDVPCCTQDTPDEVTASPDSGNFGCVVGGATLSSQLLSRINTNRGGAWPIPDDTYYWYGNCLADTASGKLVVWCNDGTPEAFWWNEAGETIGGTYTLDSCASGPIDWRFTASGGFSCLDCITDFYVTE